MIRHKLEFSNSWICLFINMANIHKYVLIDYLIKLTLYFQLELIGAQTKTVPRAINLPCRYL